MFMKEKLHLLGPWHFLVELAPGVFTIPRDQWKTLWHNIVVQDYITRTLFPMIDMLNKQKRSETTVLDIGCNEGWLSLLFHRRGFKRVVGIDPNGANIKKANFLKEHFNMQNAEFHEADINDFKTNEKFDFSIMLGVINHTCNPIGILRNIHSVTDKYLMLDFDALCEDYVETSAEARFDTSAASVFGNMRCHFEPAHQTTSADEGNLVFQYSRRAMQLMMNYAGFDNIFHVPPGISAPAHYKNDKRVILVGKKHPDGAFCRYEAALDREYMESRDYLSFQQARLEEAGYRRYNIVSYGKRYYGIPQGEMEDFDIIKVLNNKKCFLGTTLEEVRGMIEGNAGTAQDDERDRLKYDAGCELLLTSRLDEAKAVFDDLLHRHTNPVTELTAKILYQLGRIARRTGDIATARDMWNKCILLDPGNNKALMSLWDIDHYEQGGTCHSLFI